jgi:hypothetical protein
MVRESVMRCTGVEPIQDLELLSSRVRHKLLSRGEDLKVFRAGTLSTSISIAKRCTLTTTNVCANSITIHSPAPNFSTGSGTQWKKKPPLTKSLETKTSSKTRAEAAFKHLNNAYI